MITIRGKLKAAEKSLYKDFANFALGKFLSVKKIRKTKICIQFVNPKTLKGQDLVDIKRFKAWVNHYCSPERFVITINSHMKGKSALECIGHELVHVKQYVKRELVDYTNGDVSFRGVRYKESKNDEDYYFSGWEIEAYGLQEGLSQLFIRNSCK